MASCSSTSLARFRLFTISPKLRARIPTSSALRTTGSATSSSPSRRRRAQSESACSGRTIEATTANASTESASTIPRFSATVRPRIAAIGAKATS